MHPVLTERLSFWYGRVLALSDLDVAEGPGIVGVLGPNGSGKTTLLRILVGFLRPSAGRAAVFGADPWNRPALQRRIGYAPETDSLDATASGRGLVRFALGIKGFSGADGRARADRAIERVDAGSFCDRPVRTLSRGMRQRIKIAAAIANDPELLVLDEPLNGVDPVARAKLVELFRELGAEGRTLLVSSHVLSQVEALTSRIVLLHRGRLLAEGEVGEIRGLIDKHPHTIRVRTPRARELAARAAGMEEVESIGFDGDAVLFRSRRPAALYASLTRAIAELEAPVEELSCPDDNLEAVFRYLTRP